MASVGDVGSQSTERRCVDAARCHGNTAASTSAAERCEWPNDGSSSYCTPQSAPVSRGPAHRRLLDCRSAVAPPSHQQVYYTPVSAISSSPDNSFCAAQQHQRDTAVSYTQTDSAGGSGGGGAPGAESGRLYGCFDPVTLTSAEDAEGQSEAATWLPFSDDQVDCICDVLRRGNDVDLLASFISRLSARQLHRDSEPLHKVYECSGHPLQAVHRPPIQCRQREFKVGGTSLVSRLSACLTEANWWRLIAE